MLPLASEAFDGVFMLGGIHHVNDRLRSLFGDRPDPEAGRAILTPASRSAISPLGAGSERGLPLAPALDHETASKPLRREETEPLLEAAGLRLTHWGTARLPGLLRLLMNQDVLVFDRLFRFLPGIR